MPRNAGRAEWRICYCRGVEERAARIEAPQPVVPAAPVVASPRHATTDAPVRRSLVVGAVADPAESEADLVADRVVAALRSRGPSVAVPGAHDADADDGVARVRRSAFSGPEGGPIDRDTESKIQAARGGGRALASDTAERFGAAMGADFSGVRIHRGARSDELNRSLSARAFTIGNDVFMSNSAPEVGSRDGDHLLAHELTHVVQQSGGAQRQFVRRDYIHGSAAEDAELFDKEPPPNDSINVAPGSRAAHFGIEQSNMAHYLERHTFKYQRLNAKTIKPAAGMFPYKTTVADVKKWLEEALTKLPDGAAIGQSPVSQSVVLDNGLKVNVGALKGKKLSAFFPIDGGTHPGYHHYSADELKAIRDAKNAAGAA